MSDQSKKGPDKKDAVSLDDVTYAPLTRRSFIKAGIAAAAVTSGGALALSPLKGLDQPLSMDEFLQQHYLRLTPQQMEKILGRIEREIKRDHDVEASVQDIRPIPGVQFAYALNIGRCIGCRRCVYACMHENNQSRDPEIQYIRVLEMEKGSMDIEKSDHYYENKVGNENHHVQVCDSCH